MSASSGARLSALDLPPGDGFVAALLAAWDRGDAVLPLDPLAPPSARAAVLAAMRPHTVVNAGGETTLEHPAPLDDGVALVIATSGSTGEPKGAQLTHAALEASAAATAARIGETSSDGWLSCLPWQHIGGLQVMLRARRAGISLQILEKFDVAGVAAALAAGATLTSVVPTTLARLLDADIDLSVLKAILLGGAAAPPALLQRAVDAGAPTVTTYGMSETAGGCVYDGVPLDGVRVRIADDGRIELGGPTLMSGYRLRADLTAATLVDGWLRTGDLGRVDDGVLSVLGRADDVIVTGGEKVVATALAGLIAALPGIADAAVCGVPDEEWGSRVVAVVVAGPGAVPVLAAVRESLAETLPGWSLPRELLVVEALPRLASGKLDRLAVERLAQDASRAAAGSQSRSASSDR